MMDYKKMWFILQNKVNSLYEHAAIQRHPKFIGSANAFLAVLGWMDTIYTIEAKIAHMKRGMEGDSLK